MEKHRRSNKETFYYLIDTLNVLDKAITMFAEGDIEAWTIMANIVFQLLLDGSRKNTPVLRRMAIDLSFHPLKYPIHADKEGKSPYLLYVPRLEQRGTSIRANLFALDQKRIPLDEWFKQGVIVSSDGTAPGTVITIAKFISSLRDQSGGGHFDSSVDQSTKLIESFMTMTYGGREESIGHKIIIADIAQYVYEQVLALIVFDYVKKDLESPELEKNFDQYLSLLKYGLRRAQKMEI
jgi:hypothetical protein